MKIGIDSYCFHRFFGEVYPQQLPPPRRMTLENFLARAAKLGADGVSLESCFFPSLSSDYLRQVKRLLDDYEFDRVYAWGMTISPLTSPISGDSAEPSWIKVSTICAMLPKPLPWGWPAIRSS